MSTKSGSFRSASRTMRWPEAKQTFADENALDEATLVEHYAYSELQFNQQLAAKDFDRGNEAYGFRR